MRNGTFYLNNNGSRWVVFENGKRIKVIVEPDKYNGLKFPVIRSANYFQSFGNFASVNVSIKGKKIDTLSYNSVYSFLEYLREELRKGTLSYGEINELESLREFIQPDDVELLEAAGVSEEEYNENLNKE
jgi:hypothetical protein